MTQRTERALIRFLLMWFRCSVKIHSKLPEEYLDLENEVK